MGIYLNPRAGRWAIHTRTRPFVDKTELILWLNTVVDTDNRFVCSSRPRRFGKTWSADMICAYYGKGAESRGLFEHLLVASAGTTSPFSGDALPWDVYLGAFDVIHLTVTDFLDNDESIAEMIAAITDEVAGELMDAYPDVRYTNTSLKRVMGRIQSTTGTSFVVVIDEWDAPFRERPEDTEGQRLYVQFLRGVFKDKPWVALAYMTGILPIKKYGGQSSLNMFREYTMTAPGELAPYIGFTDEEVQALCETYHRDYGALKAHYDGYELCGVVPAGGSDEMLRYDVYCPYSVAEAIGTGVLRNYWNATGTFVDLAEQINRDFDGLKGTVALLMDGGRIIVNTETYLNDMTSCQSADNVLTMLVHLGYLGFDELTSEIFVPNREVLQEFANATRSAAWVEAFRELVESKMR